MLIQENTNLSDVLIDSFYDNVEITTLSNTLNDSLEVRVPLTDSLTLTISQLSYCMIVCNLLETINGYIIKKNLFSKSYSYTNLEDIMNIFLEEASTYVIS